MVRSKSEVLEWYRNADAVTRIDFVCDLLKTCLPCELRLIAVCTEELGRRNWHSLRAYEQMANSPVELRSIRDLSDAQARSKMAICLCLLRPSSQACASSLFELLVDASSRLLSGSCSPPSTPQLRVAIGGGGVPASVENPEMTATTFRPVDRPLLDDLLLLVTIAVHHPAFSVAQKYALVGRLEALKDALAAFDLPVTGGSKSGVGCGGRVVLAGGAVLPRSSASRSATAAEAEADGQPSSGRISRSSSGAPASGSSEPVQGGSEAAAAAATLQSLALQIPGDPGKEGSTVAPGKSTAGCCSLHCPSAAGLRVRSDLHRSASAANCADVSAAFVSPSSGCISSGGSVCGSPGETRKLVASSHRTRVIGIRARGATADASTSSSSPDRDLPSTSSTARHAGQRLEAGCTTGGTRQSRRTSRSGRQRSPSPKCVSGATPSSAGAAASAGTSRAVPEPSACAAASTGTPRSCRRQTSPRGCCSSDSSSSCCCSDSGDGSGCALRNTFGTSHCCQPMSMIASEPSAHAAPTPSAGCSPVSMPRTEVDVTALTEASASALSEPEPTLSSLSAPAACCDSLPSTAASQSGAGMMTQLPDRKRCCCSAKDGERGDAGVFTPALPVSSEYVPPVAACESTAVSARVGGVEASPAESPAPRARRPIVAPSSGVVPAVPADSDGNCDVGAAMPALLLSETASTTPSRSDELGLPLKDDYFVRESSETLSDPIALSPSTEPATSASSGSEEQPYSGGNGSDNSMPPYMTVAGDYAAVGSGSAAIAGPLVATGAAPPLPLPPVPHAGYAMPHHGPGGFIPGYGGMVYCYPMPFYYGAPPARSRRGRGGNGGNVGATNASAGRDLFYQPCMPPCVVMPQPMPMYRPVPQPPAMLSSQLGGETLATGAAGGCEPVSAQARNTASRAAAAGPRRVDSCYSCGHSGHTGAQCPALLQQQTSPRLASALGGFGLDLSAI